MFRGDVDGRVLTFTRTGLKGSNFIMRDAETGSDWQQLTGECFEGPLKGKRLGRVPFVYTTWGEWRAEHPETLALIPEPAYKANYEVMAKRNLSGLPGVNAKPERETIRNDDRLPPHELVLGVEVAGAEKAYPLAALKKITILNDKVGAAPVLLIHSPATDTVMVFSRVLDGRTFTFGTEESGAVSSLVDAETHSKWNAHGECIAGKLKGKKLDVLVPVPGFWFAWAEFHPETLVYSGSSEKKHNE